MVLGKMLKRLLTKPMTTNTGKEELSKSLDDKIEQIDEKIGRTNDLIKHRFCFGKSGHISAALMFIEGMVNEDRINREILKPLTLSNTLVADGCGKDLIHRLASTLPVAMSKEVFTVDDAVYEILAGQTVLLLDVLPSALALGTTGWEKRGVEKPDVEVSVRGPNEAFTETLRTNTALLRRKLQHPDLVFEEGRVGKYTRSRVCLAYVKSLVMPGLIDEVHQRLARVQVDGILAPSQLGEYIEDNPLTPFSTMSNTERPDEVAGKLLEGRLAIFVDGAPQIITVPTLFVENFQATDDYYYRAFFGTFLRIFRMLSFFLTIATPAIYVSLVSYHQELIPTPLLLTFAAAREGTPFPAVLEALAMGVMFELLREAGIRLPRQIGTAVSIVGALIIGEAAVAAGLIGEPMIVVTGVTAIASFVVPTLVEVTLVLRILLILLASVSGAFGLVMGLLLLLLHLCRLRSFGVPYLSPIAPFSWRDQKDALVRLPQWMMFLRPRLIGYRNPQRQGTEQMPKPPEERGEDGGKVHANK